MLDTRNAPVSVLFLEGLDCLLFFALPDAPSALANCVMQDNRLLQSCMIYKAMKYLLVLLFDYPDERITPGR
jgi:hypothetical protein